MKLRYLVTAALALALCAVGINSATGAKRPTFAGVLSATASGKKEVSATTGKKRAGDPDGRAGFQAVIDGDRICWSIVAKDVDGTPSGAHLHVGMPNENGPVVVPLTAPTSVDPGASSGCRTIDEDLAAALRRNPSKYYFNLHATPAYPGGAVRGQLHWKRG